TNVRFQVPAQVVDATRALNRSAGVANPRVLRGRSLSCRATLLSRACEHTDKSVPFGKYCGGRPLVFSLEPRCHGLWIAEVNVDMRKELSSRLSASWHEQQFRPIRRVALGMKMPNARSVAPFAFSLLLAVQCPTPAASESVRTFAAETGIALSVASDGSFEVTTRVPASTFAGNVGSPLSDLALQRGRDRAGGYREVEFKFKPSTTAMRLGAIRVYDHRPVVVFKLTFLTSGKTSESFPSISHYPRNLHHLAYTTTFGGFNFEQFGTDGPWIFFDDNSNAFILSPASHYMNAALSIGPHDELLGGIAADSDDIPPGFAMTSALVVAPGINRTFDIWGRFLTDLAGKKRPANDADVSLKYLGYWTDHGARYYYRFEETLGYAGTLPEVRRQFKSMNIRLGYIQLDSWFYPKGRDANWKSEDPLGGGTYRYEASRELFPKGLAAFRRRLGLPLVAHNRWIDA